MTELLHVAIRSNREDVHEIGSCPLTLLVLVIKVGQHPAPRQAQRATRGRRLLEDAVDAIGAALGEGKGLDRLSERLEAKLSSRDPADDICDHRRAEVAPRMVAVLHFDVDLELVIHLGEARAKTPDRRNQVTGVIYVHPPSHARRPSESNHRLRFQPRKDDAWRPQRRPQRHEQFDLELRMSSESLPRHDRPE